MVQPARQRVDGGFIYDQLRAEILSGDIRAGTPLREVVVAERFGVSRTPVRQALARLEHDHLLTRSTRGLVVHALSPDEVIQVYDLRIILESKAAGEAAQLRSSADIAALEGLLARDLALDDPPDRVRKATNLEFHEAVWAASHNSVLEDLLLRLGTHVVQTPRSTLSVRDRWAESLREHRALLDAIRDQDADTAEEIARTHMSTARTLRLELLRHGEGRTSVR